MKYSHLESIIVEWPKGEFCLVVVLGLPIHMCEWEGESRKGLNSSNVWGRQEPHWLWSRPFSQLWPHSETCSPHVCDSNTHTFTQTLAQSHAYIHSYLLTHALSADTYTACAYSVGRPRQKKHIHILTVQSYCDRLEQKSKFAQGKEKVYVCSVIKGVAQSQKGREESRGRKRRRGKERERIYWE